MICYLYNSNKGKMIIRFCLMNLQQAEALVINPSFVCVISVILCQDFIWEDYQGELMLILFTHLVVDTSFFFVMIM